MLVRIGDRSSRSNSLDGDIVQKDCDHDHDGIAGRFESVRNIAKTSYVDDVLLLPLSTFTYKSPMLVASNRSSNRLPASVAHP